MLPDVFHHVPQTMQVHGSRQKRSRGVCHRSVRVSDEHLERETTWRERMMDRPQGHIIGVRRGSYVCLLSCMAKHARGHLKEKALPAIVWLYPRQHGDWPHTNASLAHLRVPPANCTVVPQSPQEGVGRFVREEPLGEDDRFVLRVNSDEQHEVHAIPTRTFVSPETELQCVKIPIDNAVRDLMVHHKCRFMFDHLSCERHNTENSKPNVGLIGLRRRRTVAPVGKACVVLNDDSTPLAREELLLARRPKHVLESMHGVRVPLDIATRQVLQPRHQVEGVRWRRPELALHLSHHVPHLKVDVDSCTDNVDEGRENTKTCWSRRHICVFYVTHMLLPGNVPTQRQ